MILTGVPLAPRVEDVTLAPFPLPPRMAMPSALGKLVMVLPLIVPVVKWAVVAADPWIKARIAVPSETAALVELVRVLFEIVRLLIVPVPFSIWMPCRRALLSTFCVIETVPVSGAGFAVKRPLSLKEMLLSSCWPAAAVPTLLIVPFLNVKLVTCCPSTPLRPMF